MNKKLLSLVAAALVSIGGSAFAQGQNESSQARSNPAPTQEFTFTDQLVQGDLVRPDLATVRGGHRRSSISLLRVRNHFVQEMFKSVENL